LLLLLLEIRLSTFFLALFLLSLDSSPKSVDEILKLYIQQIGGQAALDRIHDREVDAGKRTFYWQDPDKVLLIVHGERFGSDGGKTGWAVSRKKKLTRLPHGKLLEIRIDANPLRFAHLKSLYSELQTAPSVLVDSQPMDVIVAPNDLGSTKFYFDAQTHLLARIEDFGESSAYYKHITDLSDYREVNGVKFPFRIVHTSNEPGDKAEEIRVSKVKQNVDLRPDLFSKPNLGPVVLGGKR
jgi:hypothetical protein